MLLKMRENIIHNVPANVGDYNQTYAYNMFSYYIVNLINLIKSFTNDLNVIAAFHLIHYFDKLLFSVNCFSVTVSR